MYPGDSHETIFRLRQEGRERKSASALGWSLVWTKRRREVKEGRKGDGEELKKGKEYGKVSVCLSDLQVLLSLMCAVKERSVAGFVIYTKKERKGKEMDIFVQYTPNNKPECLLTRSYPINPTPTTQHTLSLSLSYTHSHTSSHSISGICAVLVTEDTMLSLMPNPQQHGDTGRLMTQIEHFNMVCRSARSRLTLSEI